MVNYYTVEQTMYIDEEKLERQFPKIIKITKNKITQDKFSNNFEQEIVLHLPDKNKYIIKLILLGKDDCCAVLINYINLDQFRYPMQVTGT